jgi:hypothetical protein
MNNQKIEIIWSNVDSSSLDYVHYLLNNGRGVLGATFKSGDSYIYHDVPLEVINKLLNAESVGRIFFKEISHAFPFKNIGKCDNKSPLEKAGFI